MSERKVINKWYPPDFDPSLIPKKKKPKTTNGVAAFPTVRLMAPFSMRCTECGQFIYKMTKFNARKEVTSDKYLDVRIIRFHIRCPRCSRELTFLTDPKNASYKVENGLTRTIDPTHDETFADESLDERLDRLEKEHAENEEKEELSRLYGPSAAALMMGERKKKEGVFADGDTVDKSNPLSLLENRVAQNAREIALENQVDALRKRNALMEEGSGGGAGGALAKAQSDLAQQQETELEEATKHAFNRTSDGSIIRRVETKPIATGVQKKFQINLSSRNAPSPVINKSSASIGKKKGNVLGVIVKKKQ